MLDNVAAVTVRLAVPLTPDCVAVTVAVPIPTAVNKPLAEIVPTEGEVAHLTVAVTSLNVPSVKDASARSWFVAPFASWTMPGLMVMPTIAGGATVMLTDAVCPPS